MAGVLIAASFSARTAQAYVRSVPATPASALLVVELRDGDHLSERLFRDDAGRGRQVDRRGGRRLGPRQRHLPRGQSGRRQRPPLLRDPAAAGDRWVGARLSPTTARTRSSSRRRPGIGPSAPRRSPSPRLERARRTHRRRRHRDQRHQPGHRLGQPRSRRASVAARAAALRSPDRDDPRVRPLPRPRAHLHRQRFDGERRRATAPLWAAKMAKGSRSRIAPIPPTRPTPPRPKQSCGT